MFNRNYNYQIDFGSLVDVSQNLRIIKLFQKAVVDSTLYKYKDLQFTKQVVCTK
jgi:cell division protein FtsQ